MQSIDFDFLDASNSACHGGPAGSHKSWRGRGGNRRDHATKQVLRELGQRVSSRTFFTWRIEMNQNFMMRAAVTLAVLVCASVALESRANACLGLFKHKCCCESSCSSEPSCGCAAAEPSCGCAKAAEPSCAAPAAPAAPAEPSCGCAKAEEPSCGCASSSSCGCESSCGCGHHRLFGGLFHRHCCGGQSSCGCSTEPSCGCSS
jgi:hypothetical protein